MPFLPKSILQIICTSQPKSELTPSTGIKRKLIICLFYRASMQESYHLFPAAASVASTAPANFSSVSENGASGGVVSGVAATYLNANRNMLSQYTTPQTAGVAASSPISTSSATPPPPASSATVSSASPQPGIGNDQF